MPMVMPQQYMMAVRLPAGMPPPTHGQPIMAGAAGVQGMQAMQGFQVSARTREGYVTMLTVAFLPYFPKFSNTIKFAVINLKLEEKFYHRGMLHKNSK